MLVWEIVWYELLVLSIRHDDAHPTPDGSSASLATGIVWFLLLLPAGSFIYWFNRFQAEFEAAFLEQFAAANGYEFDPKGTVDKAYAAIFRLPGEQQTSDVVSGTYAGIALHMFLFETTVRLGRSDYTFKNTVMELDLPGELPHLLLVDKRWRGSKHDGPSVEAAAGIESTISLEGDFNKRFTLHAPAGSQVEALEVFSPDTMALMEDTPRHYLVEFVGNRIYIYTDGYVADSAAIADLFTLARQLVTKLSPVAFRLEHDSVLAANSNKFKHIVPRSQALSLVGRTLAVVIGFFTWLPLIALWALLLVLAHRQAGS